MPRNSQIQIRRDSTANWTSANPVLAVGEFGLDNFTKELKVGTNYTAWNSLPAFTASDLITGTTLATTLGGTGRTDGSAPPPSYYFVGQDNALGALGTTSKAYVLSTVLDTVVGVTLAANTTYEVEMMIPMSLKTGTTGGQIRMTFEQLNGLTSTPSGTFAPAFYSGNTTAFAENSITSTTVVAYTSGLPTNTAFMAPTATVGAITATNTYYVPRYFVKGTFKTITAGKLAPYISCTTLNAVASLTIHAGAYLKVTPLGTATAGADTIIGSWA